MKKLFLLSISSILCLFLLSLTKYELLVTEDKKAKSNAQFGEEATFGFVRKANDWLADSICYKLL